MKCISCGNLIPDASTICPFCNNKVEQVAAPTPVFNVNDQANTQTTEAVIPETPTQPVLPQDQGMTAAPQVNMVPPVNTVPNEMAAAANPVIQATPNEMAAPVNPAVQPAMAPTPVNEMAAPMAPTSDSPAQPMFEATAAPTTAELNSSVSPTAPSVEINPNGEMPVGMTPSATPDGAKIGSAAPKEHKNNKKTILIVVLILLVVAAIGGGLFYYFSQYKTAAKRIDEVVNGMFRNSVSVNNDNVELVQGEYSLKSSIEAKEEKIGIELDGLYGYDLSKGIMDYTLNIKSLDFGEELLDAGELNFEMYVQDSNIYFLLQNFFDKYIYFEVEDINQIFDSIEQNDINYQIITMALRDATKAGLKAVPNTQTVEDISINGKKSKVNVVRIVINEQNAEKMLKAVIDNLANNQSFISEMAKLTGEEEETIKESFKYSNDEEKTTDEDKEEEDIEATLEIYTAMFKNSFVGAKIKVDQETAISLEVYPIVNGLGFTIYEKDKKMMTYESTSTKNITSKTEENKSSINITVYEEELGALKIAIELENIKNSNPKIEKVNVKNSINAQYLTPQQVLNIYDKAASHGKLGVLIQSLLGSSMEELRTQLTTPINPFAPSINSGTNTTFP